MLQRSSPTNGFPATELSSDALTDEDVIERVLGGDTASFELILRRYNQRLFRIARSILGDDGEAEDALQEAYVRAYEHLSQFAGRAKFSTWLTRIVVHEASARRRKRQRLRFHPLQEAETLPMTSNNFRDRSPDGPTPTELGLLLRQAVDQLPTELRLVFAMRLVEGLDTAETADCLAITPANVKVRLHRARLLLRENLETRIGREVRQLFQFDGERCDRIVRRVLERLAPL